MKKLELSKILTKNSDKKFYIYIFLAFILSIYFRWDYIGEISEGHHQWITGMTLLTIENWMEDGIINDKFLNFQSPDSILYSKNFERYIYTSYPVGSYLIIYPFALLLSQLDVLKVIHYVSLLNHLVIVFFIFYFVKNLKFDLKSKYVESFAFLASVGYIFVPYAFYYHLIVFQHDTGVILPFLVILFIEYLIKKKPKKIYYYSQSLILFLAACIDYFPIALGIVLIISRSIFTINFKKKVFYLDFLKNSFQIFTPILIPYLVHFYQIYSIGKLDIIFEKFLMRSGIGGSDKEKNEVVEMIRSNFFYEFWVKKFNIYLPILIFIFSYLALSLRKSIKQNLECYILLLGFLACILYSYLLRGYASQHDFAVLKFIPLIIISLFSVIPLKLLTLTKNKKNYFYFINFISFKKLFIIFSISFFLLVCIDNFIRISWIKTKSNPYVNLDNKKMYSYFWLSQFPDTGIRNYNLLKKIRSVSNFNDVYFSFGRFETGIIPPQALSISRKIVKRIENQKDLINQINYLSNLANVNIIIDKNNKCSKLFNYNYKKFFVDDWIIIKINKRDFEKIKVCF